MIDFSETQPKSMREILDEMKSNHAKEQDENRKQAEAARSRKPPAQKKSSYEPIPNITPPLNMKRKFWDRCKEVDARLDINRYPVEEEIETEPCKYCESDIWKGRTFCSKACEIMYSNSVIG